MAIYTTRTWQVVRARALARDDHRCVVAEDDWRACSGTLDVHHITPVDDGGEPFALSNLVTLCRRHHRLAHGAGFTLRVGRRCPHRHPTRVGREACERRRAA